MKIEKIKKIIIIVLSVMAIVGVVGLLAGTLSSSGPSGGGSSGNTQICTHASTKTERENVVEARCTESGSYDNVIYCSDCNKEMSRNTVTVDALGHTEVTDAAVAATCTTTGLTEGKSCSVCNKVIVAQNVLPIINHTYDGDTDASCNVCGFVRDIDCSHTETVTLSAVEATCTTSGLTEGLKCSVCDELLTAQTVIDPLGHTEVKDVAVAATCTTTGLTEGKHCSVCNEVLIAQTVIDTLPHTPGDSVIVEEVEPLCIREGYTKFEIRCTVCNTVISTDFVEYPKRDHAFSDGVCMYCGLAEYSLGLEYVLSNDGSYYSVQGIGTCTDTEIIVPSSYESIPVKHVGITNTSGFTSIVIPNGVTYVTFKKCPDLTNIVIPDSVERLGDQAFQMCTSLSSITIGNGVQTIGISCFEDCTSLKTVVIPDSVKTLDVYAFRGCTNLSKVIIGNSVNRIALETFSGCTRLSSIVIPSSVTSIGDSGNAFKDCTSFDVIYYVGDTESWSNVSFNATLCDATVYCYSETQPTDSGNYWHYVGGVVTVWPLV